jgi:hypothetical protein
MSEKVCNCPVFKGSFQWGGNINVSRYNFCSVCKGIIGCGADKEVDKNVREDEEWMKNKTQ